MDEFEALLAAYTPAVERWVKFRVHSLHDAEDILQETYLAAYQAFPRLADHSAFRPWLLGIARNKWVDWVRAESRRPELPVDTLPERAEELPPETAVEETLASLPERDRMMLSLFYRRQLPQKAIAQRLAIPEGTVKSRLNTARSHFRAAYPYPPKGENIMKKSLPEYLPEYTIRWKREAPFPIVWEELMGWFIVPKPGEKLTWGMYDLPSRKLDVGYDMRVTGKASVHGLEGVSITAKALQPTSPAQDGPISDAVEQSGAEEEEWTFVAQLANGYTRFLSAERMENGVRTLTTFLDGDDFMLNWGFGENNCGNPIHISPKGVITRKGADIQAERPDVDMVGRCEVTLDGKTYDTVCVMDLGQYNEGVVSEQYLGRDGRTVLWRRFNRDDWAVDRYGKPWSALLPDNEQITVNGQCYVHWYDCICIK